MNYDRKWFTLIELIIVITVLTILATLWFISFWDYTWQSRDSKRVSDLLTIEKWIILSSIENWEYPEPENTWKAESIDWIEWIKWEKWKFWDEQFNEVKRLSDLPLDPKSKEKYDYYVSVDKKFYILKSKKEVWWDDIIITNYSKWLLSDDLEKLNNWVVNLGLEQKFVLKNEKLWEVTWYYEQELTNLKWFTEKVQKKWANGDYSEPIWNWNDYIFDSWKTINDYPAFKYCRDKWSKWRLPTRNELLSILNYKWKNDNWAYSNLPLMDKYYYLTSTKNTFSQNTYFIIGFNLASTSYQPKTNNINNYVVCIHD